MSKAVQNNHYTVHTTRLQIMLLPTLQLSTNPTVSVSVSFSLNHIMST
jgi:hypothetical protein